MAPAAPLQEKEPLVLEVQTRRKDSRGKITNGAMRPKVWMDDVDDAISYAVSKLPAVPAEAALTQCRATLTSIALEFCLAGSVKLGGTTFTAWSTLRSHIQALVPKFLSSPGSSGIDASTDYNLGDALLNALQDDEPEETQQQTPSGSPAEKTPAKPDILKTLLESEPRMRELKLVVTERVQHDMPIRTHFLFATLRNSIQGDLGQLTVQQDANNVVAAALAEKLLSDDVFNADWCTMISAVQSNVVEGKMPPWMAPLIPASQIPYFLGIRERYMVEVLHEALQLDEDEFVLQPAVRARWRAFVKGARKPSVGKTAVLDFMEATSKMIVDADKETYKNIVSLILATDLNESSSIDDISRLSRAVKRILDKPKSKPSESTDVASLLRSPNEKKNGDAAQSGDLGSFLAGPDAGLPCQVLFGGRPWPMQWGDTHGTLMMSRRRVADILFEL